ncbi:MAG: ATP-binding protein [Pirellulaceae bacterium]
MWSSRLFWKLLLAFGAVYLVFALLHGLVLSNQQRELLRGHVRQRLEGNAVLLRSLLEEEHFGPDNSTLARMIKPLENQIGTRINVLNSEYQTVADSHDDDPIWLGDQSTRPEIRAAASQGNGEAVRRSATLGKLIQVYALPLFRRGEPDGFVTVAMELDAVERQVAAANQRWLTITLLVGALMAPICYLVVGHVIRPLAQFNDALRAIADGDYSRRVHVSSKDELGRLAAALNTMQEQLERRVSQMQENSDHMATVLSGMVEGVVAVDPQQRVMLANTASCALLEVASKEVVGRPLLEVVRNRDVQRVVVDALEAESPITREIVLSTGPRRVLRVLGARLPGIPCPGAVVVLHDVTELRRLENLRRDFVANVSHELKTPLAAIKAYAETLRMGAIHDAEHSMNFVVRIEEHAHRLHQLIVDLLHLARVETGREVFDFEEVAVQDAVADSVAHHADTAAGAGVQLAWRGSSEDLTIWADISGFQTILDNLISNAIKYTPAGGSVMIEWRRAGKFAEIVVTDTGIGIAPQDQQRVFERFFRVDRARSRDLGGTGLGLAIVKHLSQSFGGDVGLTSELGRGSSFFVRLPLSPAASG